MVEGKQRIADEVGCHGIVEFVRASSVRAVVNGIKTVLHTSSTVDGSSSLLPVAGLTSPAVQHGTNTDSAVEFEFKRPARLAGIWLRQQVDEFHHW